MAAVLVAAAAPGAQAHPFAEETVPERFSSAPRGTSEVVVYYSEGIEIGFSELRVLDSSGERVDGGGTAYHEGDHSLVVTTPPLPDGVYTVTSRVLSKVDGHLVDYAFVFAVGGAAISPEDAGTGKLEFGDIVFLPEAGARMPGLAGQAIVLGSAIAMLFVWGARRAGPDGDSAARLHGRFVSLVGVGLVAVLASNLLMLAAQSLRLGAPAFDALQTTFGATWMARMAITAALLGAWFVAERAKRPSGRTYAPTLALGLALIATTTMMGHGTAAGEPAAAALDYLHGLAAAAWIGGIAFLAFALLPALRASGQPGERAALAALPRFSVAAAASIGAAVAAGPLLMWMLEGDVGAIAGSTYGKLLAAKIALAAAMVGVGLRHQLVIQRAAERIAAAGGRVEVTRRLGRALRAEFVLGMALLGAVALLANGTLPEGELGAAAAEAAPAAGLRAAEFSEAARFDVEVLPFSTGTNTIRVAAAGLDGGPIPDLEGVGAKISSPGRGVSPIEVPMRAEPAGDGPASFAGEAAFGFPGEWLLEVEARRSAAPNEGVAVGLLVKPRLSEMGVEIIEYDLPEPGAPLYPLSDGRGSIWISDASAPRVWRFSIADGTFEKHEFDGQASISLAVDNDGKVWFTDIPEGRIGYVDPRSGGTGIVEFPAITPATARNYPITLDVDAGNGVWAAVSNKNVLVRYDQETGGFDVHDLPTKDSGPFAVAVDGRGDVWFSQQSAGQIGRLDPASGNVTEIAPAEPLAAPETVTFGRGGGMWIAEHEEGGGIARYDPYLGAFERVASPDPAAFPNSASTDGLGNVWFALHTVDKIAAHDPHRGETIAVPIPTAGSWVQFTTVDEDGNVWFAEQKPNKLAMVKTTAPPGAAGAPPPGGPEEERGPRYAEIAAPLMAAAIVASALFLVKGVSDCRRIDGIVAGGKGGRPAPPAPRR